MNYPLTSMERSCHGQASVTGVTSLAIKHCTLQPYIDMLGHGMMHSLRHAER